MKIETILPQQILEVRLNEYTVTLAVSEVDAEQKKFRLIDIGTFTITLTSSFNNYEIISRLKKIYPEITKYRNVEVLQKVRKDVILELDFDNIIAHTY